MVRIAFTDNLQKHLPCPPMATKGSTVREVLEVVFKENSPLRSYLLDDQGRLRKHVNIFVNGDAVTDRARLSDPVVDDDQVFVFQALSGG